MSAMSTPSRKKSWQTGRERVSVLAALAIKKEYVSRRLLRIREDLADPRTGKALSQEKAAARVGATSRTWQRWENGETVPYPRNLSAIADEFGFDVAEFFDAEPGSVVDTPDLMASADGNVLARLAHIENKLELLEQALREASIERVGLVDQILGLLKQQSRLLEDIRTLVGDEDAFAAFRRALVPEEPAPAVAQPPARSRSSRGSRASG